MARLHSYTVQGGLAFERNEDASVSIFTDPDATEPIVTLPDSQWASVVAFCSAHGEDGYSHALAIRFQTDERFPVEIADVVARAQV
jgi:hypothetical protein